MWVCDMRTVQSFLCNLHIRTDSKTEFHLGGLDDLAQCGVNAAPQTSSVLNHVLTFTKITIITSLSRRAFLM